MSRGSRASTRCGSRLRRTAHCRHFSPLSSGWPCCGSVKARRRRPSNNGGFARAGFAKALKVKFSDIEVGRDLDPEARLADNGDLEQDLQALLETIGTAAAKEDTALVIFIDELQYVEEKQLEALISAIHRCAQRQLPITLVGAGLPQPRGRMGNAKARAERLFDFPEVGPLCPEVARRAVTKSLTDEHIQIEPEAVDTIIAITRGYPYLLQEWGKHTWDAARRSPITRSDVERDSRSALATLDESFFRVRLDRLTPGEKRYLRAMAELGPGRIAREISPTSLHGK